MPELTTNYSPDSVDLVAFVLDDTLAPSKSSLDPRMAGLLADLFGPELKSEAHTLATFSMTGSAETVSRASTR